MDNSDLAKRMKEYESVSKTKLIRRMPVIIRIDGRAFHTFTKGFQRPFDEVLIKSMQDTMKYLCENIQNCALGYHQSDEITLLLVDYKELDTSPWFDNEVQKICSITASMATMVFNKCFQKYVKEFTFTIPKNGNKEKTLNGITFCITGSLMEYKNRDELKQVLESNGAKVTNSVTSKTTYLINNDTMSNSSKNIKAKKLGVKIISEDELHSLIK